MTDEEKAASAAASGAHGMLLAHLAQIAGIAPEEIEEFLLQNRLRQVYAWVHATDTLAETNSADADPEGSARVLASFIHAPSWGETYAVLEQQQSILLSNVADQLLVACIILARQKGKAETAAKIELHRLLLAHVREVGCAAAWIDFQPALYDYDNHPEGPEAHEANLLLAWLNNRGRREQRRFLEAHPELIHPRSEVLLGRLLVQFARQPRKCEELHEHLWLLQRIRKDQDEHQRIRRAYVDLSGGWVLDLPSWLDEVMLEMVRLLETAPSVQTVEHRIAMLRAAIERFEQEQPGVWDVLATLQWEFGRALREIPDVGGDQLFEATKQAYQASLQIYSLADYPKRYARVQVDLGNLYAEHMAGERRENLESAIACFQAALLVSSLVELPKSYADIQSNLGNAYAERIAGIEQENLEEAIACFQAALQVYTLADFPQDYARTQHSLGHVYVRRTTGGRRENLEQAITAYQAAIGVYTLADFPEPYATTQRGLGFAHAQRIAGVRRENLEAAIRCYQAALQVFTLADFPADYAHTLVNLGLAYFERIAGVRRENLEQSLALYQTALQVYTLADFPYNYAQTQGNLGNTYRIRIAGVRRENQERALACYQEALQVFTLADYPLDYARAQVDLGNTYSERLAGILSQNREAAIECYESSLQVFTLADFPADYALSRVNLGNAYSDRILGERWENLEQTIACYQQALQIFNPLDFPEGYARAQVNLGNAYSERVMGVRRENLQQAIDCYQAALQVYTLADFPEDYRDTQLNLAWLAFEALASEASARGDQDSVRDAYKLSSAAYAAARLAQAELGWLESSEQGRAMLQGQHDFVRDMYARHAWGLWQLGQLEAAVVALEAGRAQALAESQAIADSQLGETCCQDHRSRFQDVRHQLQEARRSGEQVLVHEARNAFLEVRQAIRGHCQPDFLPSEPSFANILEAAAPEQALVYLSAGDQGGMAFVLPPNKGAEKSESHKLSVISLPRLTWQVVDNWLLRLGEAGKANGGFQYALHHAGVVLLLSWLQRIESVAEQERMLALPLQEVPAVLPEMMGTLRQALQEVVTEWKKKVDFFGLGTKRQQEAAKVLADQLDMSLQACLEKGFLGSELNWAFAKVELKVLLPQLSDVLLRPLRQALNDLGLDAPNQSIALIPCGRLGVLPLHAALVPDPATGEEVPFQETCELTYQASARVLAVSRSIATVLPSTGALLTVGNPQPTRATDLPWAEAEAEAIALSGREAQRPESQAILGEEATLSRIKGELATIQGQASGAWVEIASHGRTDASDPQNSYMLLAYNERLTLAELQRERLLEGVRCFTASGCVTGLGDLKNAPDELSSFASGVLQAGAACAIATLWSVSDQATFLLMVRFYRLILDDHTLTPSRGLREAAKWLRRITQEDLDELSRKGLMGMQSLRALDAALVRDALRGTNEWEQVQAPLAEDVTDPLRLSASKALSMFRLVDAVHPTGCATR